LHQASRRQNRNILCRDITAKSGRITRLAVLVTAIFSVAHKTAEVFLLIRLDWIRYTSTSREKNCFFCRQFGSLPVLLRLNSRLENGVRTQAEYLDPDYRLFLIAKSSF